MCYLNNVCFSALFVPFASVVFDLPDGQKTGSKDRAQSCQTIKNNVGAGYRQLSAFLTRFVSNRYDTVYLEINRLASRLLRTIFCSILHFFQRDLCWEMLRTIFTRVTYKLELNENERNRFRFRGLILWLIWTHICVHLKLTMWTMDAYIRPAIVPILYIWWKEKIINF